MFSQQAFRAALLRLIPPSTPCVAAYSGGLDSHVLLNLVQRLALFPLRAIHVHHGLQARADDWAEHCTDVCREMQIPLDLVHVDARPDKGQSPEEAARTARYRVLRERLGDGEILLTAHHADDQAETLLLQLLRGAGVHGLAGMPERAEFGRGLLVRPLLSFSRAALLDYATAHRLAWMEDTSNADESYDRNFLRRQVMPLLMQRWPAAPEVLARSAAHCAEAARILDERAGELLVAVQGGGTDSFGVSVTKSAFNNSDGTVSPSVIPAGNAGIQATGMWTRAATPMPLNLGLTVRPEPVEGRAVKPFMVRQAHHERLNLTTLAVTLPITPLLELAESDQRLVLRAWLRANGFRMPPAHILERVLREAIPARPDRTPQVEWSEGEIRRYRNRLYLLKPLPPVPPHWHTPWRGDAPLMLPDGRTLHAMREKGEGIAPHFWQPETIEVRYRQGGERCRLPARAGTHELKKLLQEAGLPPWERERLPLIYIDGQLAAVGDVWVCEAFAGRTPEVNVRLHWNSDGE